MRVQRGFTILEVMIAMAIIIPSMIGAFWLYDIFSLDTRLQGVAQQHKQWTDEYAKYVKANNAALLAAAGPATPVAIDFATLQAAGFAPNMQATNVYGQTVCMVVIEPNPNELQVIVGTEGGNDIPKNRVRRVAALVGAAGGYVLPATPNTANSAFNVWGPLDITVHRTTDCSGTAIGPDHVVSTLFFDDGNLIQGYLYRNAVPGHPEANQMNTSLDMDGNDINNVDYIVLSSAEVDGAVCPAAKTIAADANGNVLSCDTATMTWKRQGSAFWEDPVATFAALPVCNAAARNVTRVVETPTTGTGRRAYTCNGAGAWNALAVDDFGNLTVANDLTVSNNATITNNLTVNGNTTLGNAAADTVTIPGNASIDQLSGDLEITTVAVEGTACAPNGRLARDANGLILSCQSGVWGKGAGLWTTLSLADTNNFNPRCNYIVNGIRYGYVDTTKIQTVSNGISSSTTATWYSVYAVDKTLVWTAQDNYSNNTVYPSNAVTTISYLCP